jgi:integrase
MQQSDAQNKGILTLLAQMYDAWEAVQRIRGAQRQKRSARARGFSDRTAMIYRQRWEAFARFCIDNKLSVKDIQTQAVADFANSRSVRAVNATERSFLTVDRYCALVLDVLRHAALQGLVPVEPDEALNWIAQARRSVAEPMVITGAAKRARDSLVIEPALLMHALHFKDDESRDFEGVRDALLLSLVGREALTPSEIRELSVDDVYLDQPVDALDPNALDRNTVDVLQLRGTRRVQTRRIVIHAETSKLLRRYLQAMNFHRGGGNYLLRADLVRDRVTTKTIYVVCANAMRKACDQLRRPVALHLGPTTLRNACLAYWLGSFGRGLDEASRLQRLAQRAGLSSPVSLQRLSHAQIVRT